MIAMLLAISLVWVGACFIWIVSIFKTMPSDARKFSGDDDVTDNERFKKQEGYSGPKRPFLDALQDATNWSE